MTLLKKCIKPLILLLTVSMIVVVILYNIEPVQVHLSLLYSSENKIREEFDVQIIRAHDVLGAEGGLPTEEKIKETGLASIRQQNKEEKERRIENEEEEYKNENSNSHQDPCQQKYEQKPDVPEDSTITNTKPIPQSEECIPGINRDVTPRSRFQNWQTGQAVDPAESHIGPDHVTDKNKYLIYRCDTQLMRKCAGWADRVKGILNTYIIANLTGRVFKVEILDQGCPLTDFIMHAEVNWTLPYSFHPRLNKTTPDAKLINLVYDRGFDQLVHSLNLTQYLDPSVRFVYFKTNHDYIPTLQRSKYYKSTLSWMTNVGRDRIIAILIRRLFRYTPDFLSKLNNLMSPVAHEAGDKMVCAHVRIGDPMAFFNNYHNHIDYPNLEQLWKFLLKISKDIHQGTQLSSNKTYVFVSSDVSRVLIEAKEQCFSETLLTVEGKIVHIDKNGRHSQQERCDGFRKSLLEQAVFMNCDALVVARESGFSGQASFLRGTNHQLYRLLSNYSLTKISLKC